MEPAAQKFQNILNNITIEKPIIPIISNVTAEPVTNENYNKNSFFFLKDR